MIGLPARSPPVLQESSDLVVRPAEMENKGRSFALENKP